MNAMKIHFSLINVITSPFYNRIVYQGYISLMMIEICVFGYETFMLRARRIHFWVLDCKSFCVFACVRHVCVCARVALVASVFISSCYTIFFLFHHCLLMMMLWFFGESIITVTTIYHWWCFYFQHTYTTHSIPYIVRLAHKMLYNIISGSVKILSLR